MLSCKFPFPANLYDALETSEILVTVLLNFDVTRSSKASFSPRYYSDAEGLSHFPAAMKGAYEHFLMKTRNVIMINYL